VVGATEAQARAAFGDLSNASIHASAVGVLSAQSQYLRDAITDRLRQGFSPGPAMPAAGNVLSHGPEPTTTPVNEAQPAGIAGPVYAMWAEGLGGWGALQGNGNAAKTDYSLGGVITGVDVTFDQQWRIGMAGGYSRTSFDAPGSSGSSDNYHAALYGGGQFGDWGLRAGANLSWSDITRQRGVVVANLSDTARGDYGAWTKQLFGEVGHRFVLDRFVVEPFANIAYVRVDSSVNDTGIAGVSGDAGIDTTYTTLGMRGAAALSDEWTVRGMLGWRHAFGDVVPEAALAFTSGGPEFSLAGSPIARDALVAEAGLDLTITPDILLGVSWTGQFGDDAHDNAVKANFTLRF
jgi:outer membrane autotransporter protein